MKYLIVGLGNIGPEYHETRHNAGFMVLDYMAQKQGVTFTTTRYGSIAKLRLKSAELLLLKPSTYMNLSGDAVRYWLQEERLDLTQMLVVVDDLALPFGELRLKPSGSDAGHNGLKHIQATLGTQGWARLRVGIGNEFSRGGQINFVLGHFPPEEQALMPRLMEAACEVIRDFCLIGCARAMNIHNRKRITAVEPPKETE